MEKLIVLLSMTFCTITIQAQMFFYRFKMQHDSTTKAKPHEELAVLIMSKKGSVFYGEDKVKFDSLIYSQIEKSLKTGSNNVNVFGMKRGILASIVTKSYPSYKVNFKNIIYSELYSYEEKRKLNWQISKETQKIREWNCQKAEVDYLGRKWIAWFTNSIPIPDGPYKFHGLPGLIVKIEDTNQEFGFTLEGVSNKVIERELESENAIAITYEKYKKLFVDNYLDPGKRVRQAAAQSDGSDVAVEISEDGKIKFSSDIARDLDKLAKTRKITDINPLEKDLTQ